MTGFCSVGKGHVEREANEFASWLLTPLDDFRKQIAPRDKPDFDAIGKCASRYDVSLVAAVLRWQGERSSSIPSTDTSIGHGRAILPSSGIFIRISRGPVELPPDPPLRRNSSRRKYAVASIPPERGSISVSKNIGSGARSTRPLTRCSIYQTRAKVVVRRKPLEDTYERFMRR